MRWSHIPVPDQQSRKGSSRKQVSRRHSQISWRGIFQHNTAVGGERNSSIYKKSLPIVNLNNSLVARDSWKRQGKIGLGQDHLWMSFSDLAHVRDSRGGIPKFPGGAGCWGLQTTLVELLASKNPKWAELGDFACYGERKCIVKTEAHQNIIFFSYGS